MKGFPKGATDKCPFLQDWMHHEGIVRPAIKCYMLIHLITDQENSCPFHKPREYFGCIASMELLRRIVRGVVNDKLRLRGDLDFNFGPINSKWWLKCDVDWSAAG